MKKHVFIILCLFLVIACRDGGEEERVKKYRTDKMSDLIRNPVQSDGTIDSSRLAEISFDNTSYDFGIIDQGDSIRHVFHFTNTGNIPLVISDVQSTCGCTVPKSPKDPIESGERGSIEVIFDSSDREGKQKKAITVYSNTIPNESKLYLSGTVRKKN